MNELQIFSNPEFGEVRTIVDDGAVLFCGSDVARALGYSRPNVAVAAHAKGAVKRCTLTNGGEQEMAFIPESDLYRLIFRSKLPSAERFTDWVKRSGSRPTTPETKPRKEAKHGHSKDY